MEEIISKAKNICGIYSITNIETNKRYIGSSINIGNRWYCHINLLKNNNHTSTELQRDWNELNGIDSFKFDILQECEREFLLEVEQKYIDKYDAIDLGYNSVNSARTNTSGNNKYQIPLKIDQQKDDVIYNVINACDNKSDFIKNALFYYIYQIQYKNVIDRNYPYNKVL